MANKRISDLSEKSGTPDNDDYLLILDIHDTSQGAAGTDKKVTLQNVWNGGTAGPAGPAGPSGSVWRHGTGPPSDGLGADNDFYFQDDTFQIYQRVTGHYSVTVTLPELVSSDTNKVVFTQTGAVVTADFTNVPKRGDTPHVVRAATTAALASNTYANGTAGVGATLTATGNGALAAVDGVTLVANDEVLVKNESTGANNGRYTVTAVGDGTHPYILTRFSGADTSGNLLAGHGTVIVREGTVNSGVQFWLNADVATVGTTAVTYASTPLGASYVTGTSILGLGGIVFNGDTTITRTTTAGVIGGVGYSVSGLTGATAAVRYVGATTSGAPGSGTFLTGDFVVDQTAVVWVCTAGGSPGTWVAPTLGLTSVLGSDASPVNNSTVLVDTGLSLTLAANATYKFEAALSYDGSQAGDMKIGLVGPASATANWYALGASTSATTQTNGVIERIRTISATEQAGGAGVGTNQVLPVFGIVQTSSTAGTFKIQYAQNVADATNLTVRAASYLIAKRYA
jgi:hypothetical protein